MGAPKIHGHGTRACYQSGCRRNECIEAQRTYSREWARLNGSFHRKYHEVPTTRAIQHIKELMVEGMGYRSIADASGVSHRHLFSIATGRCPRGIRNTTEARILAVTAAPYMVPAIGTQRRIQALAALGHKHEDIARSAGMNISTMNRTMRQDKVYRTTADAIKATYDELSMIVGASDYTRNRATSRGWVTPLAWDDDTIDDPTARPIGARDHRDDDRSTHPFDLDEWAALVHAGEDPRRATVRCGATLTAVERAAWRAGRNDLATLASRARKRWSA